MVRKTKKSIEASEATVTDKINNFIDNSNDNMSDDEQNIYIESLRKPKTLISEETLPTPTIPAKPKLKRVKKAAVVVEPPSSIDYKLEYEKLKGKQDTTGTVVSEGALQELSLEKRVDKVGWNKNTKLF